MNKNIDNDFGIDLDMLETPHGIFTSNTYLGLSAREVYEQYLHELENPPEPKKTIEEIVEEQANKINSLEQGLRATLRGDMQELAYILYPNDFDIN